MLFTDQAQAVLHETLEELKSHFHNNSRFIKIEFTVGMLLFHQVSHILRAIAHQGGYQTWPEADNTKDTSAKLSCVSCCYMLPVKLACLCVAVSVHTLHLQFILALRLFSGQLVHDDIKIQSSIA